MCGIIAAVEKPGQTNLVHHLIHGLKRLEYRGYDSAGLALVHDKKWHRLRCSGRVSQLEAQTHHQTLPGRTGIAHTRWATHGVPSERNAHPLVAGEVCVVCNGIIENFATLKQDLEKTGVTFDSDTDTEVIAHLVQKNLEEAGDLFLATRKTLEKLVGSYAVVILFSQQNRLIAARCGAPLLLGLGKDGNYIASDASALISLTKKFIYLEDGDVTDITDEEYKIFNTVQNDWVKRAITVSGLKESSLELGQYPHYMKKEIHEQPEALSQTLEIIGTSKTAPTHILDTVAQKILPDVDSILILACGTSYYAGLTASYWFESIAGISCRVEIASEYRYRQPVMIKNCLVIGISQSGETADTLAALDYAKSQSAMVTLALCNVPESSLIRTCDLRLITRAGPEIGVASTKAFTTQLAALYLLCLTMAQSKKQVKKQLIQKKLDNLRHLPNAIRAVFNLEPAIIKWANILSKYNHALYLGRGPHYPIALEGALKMKELAYIHAEGYAAGELKHGPLALIDENMPVIAIAPDDMLLNKLTSNIHEVSARDGKLYVFADLGCELGENDNTQIIRLPEHYDDLSAIIHAVPLQMLAYHTALLRGNDVDKPRNLAKSVTVE